MGLKKKKEKKLRLRDEQLIRLARWHSKQKTNRLLEVPIRRTEREAPQSGVSALRASSMFKTK